MPHSVDIGLCYSFIFCILHATYLQNQMATIVLKSPEFENLKRHESY